MNRSILLCCGAALTLALGVSLAACGGDTTTTITAPPTSTGATGAAGPVGGEYDNVISSCISSAEATGAPADAAASACKCVTAKLQEAGISPAEGDQLAAEAQRTGQTPPQLADALNGCLNSG